jgi:hypothetical protein
MEELVQQWVQDRTRSPLLLKTAVALQGVDAVIAYAIEIGVSKNVIMFTLRRYGCIQSPARERDPDPFYTKVKKLWRQDKARLMALVEEFYRG